MNKEYLEVFKMINKIIKYVGRNISMTTVGIRNEFNCEVWQEKTL